MRTPSEVASRLRISRSTLYRMAEAGLIPASRIGGQWRFDPERIDAWLDDGRDEGGRDE
jgi:excisionase family DNA binding protein